MRKWIKAAAALTAATGVYSVYRHIKSKQDEIARYQGSFSAKTFRQHGDVIIARYELDGEQHRAALHTKERIPTIKKVVTHETLKGVERAIFSEPTMKRIPWRDWPEGEQLEEWLCDALWEAFKAHHSKNEEDFKL